MLKIPSGISDTDRKNSHSFFHSSYFPQMSLLVGLPESSGGRVRSYAQPASSSPWLSTAFLPMGHVTVKGKVYHNKPRALMALRENIRRETETVTPDMLVKT
jgi:hypothetical protein